MSMQSTYLSTGYALKRKHVFVIFCLLSATVTCAEEENRAKERAQAYTHRLRAVHGITASLAWVFFFPVGAILLPLLRGPKAFWVHAFIQTFSIALFVAAVTTGIIIARKYRALDYYHAIIGLVLFALVFVQAVGGIVHHKLFKKLQRRTVVSYVHIWLGRIAITLGMINGGLGLLWAKNTTRRENIAYGVVAGVIWILFVAVSVYGTTRTNRQDIESYKDPSEKAQRLLKDQRQLLRDQRRLLRDQKSPR